MFLLGSGSIRKENLGPVVTKGDLSECFPYDDSAHMLYVKGSQLKRMIKHMLRDEALAGNHCEFYQLSEGMLVEYDQESHSFIRFEFNEEPVDDEKIFTLGLQHFHFLNIEDSFGITLKELQENHKDRVVSTSCTQIIEEALLATQHQNAKGEGRLIVHRKK